MRTIRLLTISSLFAATAFIKPGPAWISIEYPVNPYDGASRGAFLLVHAYHHGTSVGLPVTGTAEGIVDGARRTVSLEFKNTSRPGVYALNKQWSTNGTWTLVIRVTQGSHEFDSATALVELSATGQVASVNVPTKMDRGYVIPTPVAMADVDAALRARAARIASR